MQYSNCSEHHTGQTNPRPRRAHKRTNLFTYQRANLPDRNTPCTANAVPQGIRPISIIFRRQSFPDLSTPVKVWWRRTGSNRRPPACKAGALPAELRPHQVMTIRQYHMISPGVNTTEDWWAREDLNLRPHAYQACALTN